jgi:hypothetical protein
MGAIILGLVVGFIIAGFIHVYWEDILALRNAKFVKEDSRLQALEKENELLTRVVESQKKDNRLLLDVIELGFPYPTIEGYRNEEERINELIEKELKNGPQE